jgi:hypothetical protein
MIDDTRGSVAVSVNAALTALYWHIGRLIHQDILKEKRAEYGAEIVASLSRQLVQAYGGGFSEKTIAGWSSWQRSLMTNKLSYR